MPLHALLFDLDGTLADSDPLHFLAYRDVLARRGIHIDEHYFATRMSGHSNGEICQTLFPDADAAEHARVAAEKEARFRASVGRIRPVAGLHPLLGWANGRGLALAVVSNAPRANIVALLDALDIAGHFTAVISGEELPRGKPDPLPYATALAELGIAAEHAVAFEDAVPGLTSAVRAGLATVGMLTTQPADVLRGAGAVTTVRDFTDPALMGFLGGRL